MTTRRTFIAGLGSAAVTWPRGALGQQSNRKVRIGVLIGYAEDDPETKARLAALRQGLQKRGWFEGRNIQIETRFAAGSADKHAHLAKELVAGHPDVILAHTTPVVAAVRHESRAIPI